MALFDALIDDLANRLGLGGAAAPLAREALALIAGADGGIAGFLGLFRRAGLGATAKSWLGQTNPASLSTPELEAALGAPAIDAIAHRAGIALPATTAALGYALPKIVGLLTPHGSFQLRFPRKLRLCLRPTPAMASLATIMILRARSSRSAQARSRLVGCGRSWALRRSWA